MKNHESKSEQLAKLTDENSLAILPPQKVINTLFTRKRMLLELARNNPTIQEEIVERRAKIALFFRTHGGAIHEPTAQLFENLQTPEDIIPHIPEAKTEIIKPKLLEESIDGDYRSKAGYFVFGKALSAKEEKAIKEQRGTPTRKIGNAMEIDAGQLVLAADRLHGRAIYINGTPTNELLLQLEIARNLNPDIIDRLFFFELSAAGKVVLTPYADKVKIEGTPGCIPIGEEMTEGQKMAKVIHTMLTHQLKINGLYIGEIVNSLRDTSFGILVRIIQERKGLIGEENIMFISKDDLTPPPENIKLEEYYEEGTEIAVVLREKDYGLHRSIHYHRGLRDQYRLDEKEGRERIIRERPEISHEMRQVWKNFVSGIFPEKDTATAASIYEKLSSPESE